MNGVVGRLEKGYTSTVHIPFTHTAIDLSETHSLELHSQLAVGEFEGSGNGLEIVY